MLRDIDFKKVIKGVNLGKIRVWLNRLQMHAGLANLFMISYLFLSREPLGIEWYYWVIPGLILLPVVFYIDLFYVFPQMQEYQFNKNPEMVNLKNEVKELKKQVSANNDNQLLKEIHDSCDKANFRFGNEEYLCIFCSSNQYDGKGGVKHKDNCIIQKLRNRKI